MICTPIKEFQGEYRWLSNFVGGVEEKYQAAKTTNPVKKQWVLAASSPGQAKRRGRQVPIRSDWDYVKDQIMYKLVKEKFNQEPYRSKLLATGYQELLAPGYQELIEGNCWGDNYWGVCNGVGQNRLGKIIMRVRDELRAMEECEIGGCDFHIAPDKLEERHAN